ncbi:MAG: hypothetical protein ACFFAO_21735, partial [Candidatus Hermodarchaeota archaeon]
ISSNESRIWEKHDFSLVRNPENKIISCKRAKGWEIINSKKAQKAEELLKIYNFLCQIEANSELRKIRSRIGKQKKKINKVKIKKLKLELLKIAPSQLGGFKDCWDKVKPLAAEG